MRRTALSALTTEEPDYVDSDFDDGNSTEEDSAEDIEAEQTLQREEREERRVRIVR